jgi:5-hydroxyisourate hydrolase
MGRRSTATRRAQFRRAPARRSSTDRTTAMGKLTTHVIDLAHGMPAAGVDLALYRHLGDRFALVKTAVTGADGRCAGALLDGTAFAVGRYRLVFQAGAYFAARGVPLADPPFVDEVVVEFGIADAAAHYHVPLLVSPWSYSTYRGS